MEYGYQVTTYNAAKVTPTLLIKLKDTTVKHQTMTLKLLLELNEFTKAEKLINEP